jgi:RNA polymerase sigma-70 factor (ECF subfamily)
MAGPQGAEHDLKLMQGVAARDSAALRALYDRYSGLVYTLGLRILRDRADAEELLVDVFWEIWSRGDRFDASRGTPLTYLMTLTRSRAIDRTRGRGKMRPLSLQSEESPEPAGAGSPTDDALGAERRDVIRQAIGQLEPQQRQAIECSFYDGLSHSEIADKLGKPLGTVKTYIRQGLIRLRESLRTAYGGAV